jgi:hypothetical protein
MTDIVKRLRHAAYLWEPDEKSSIQLEAAAEIERLRAALAAIRALPSPSDSKEGGK